MSNLKKAAVQVGTLIAAAVIIALWGCDKIPMNTEKAKKTVYDNLDDFSRDMIIGTWEDGEIVEFKLDPDTVGRYTPSENVDIEKYIGKTVYRLHFETTMSGLLGNVDVIADRATGEIIAQAPYE